ncbi:UDP-N-acetylmuramate--L-alanine ligase [Actinomycetospora sp. NBRC 106378]|uniref:UDP-N-acetylmuramate--L-alanine ligase n=1 Tax=Actinomycetospora sp. NBRC 106378 TaxID=3032208 RepID=UPI0024A0A1BD|nr:UDP-N-acetylmuramate--L-alanine ligase [Actinomycetospora sp. NBRC 106378]GLZ53366.1 UDP-N-acetylmuramate--L-alanine ligase [Actinomycetospora sp. NBRC 106378]
MQPGEQAVVPELPRLLSRVHFIGAGGAAMSGIARILLARGAMVSGSDAKDSRAVLALRTLGAEVSVGHDAANLDLLPGGPTALVTTKAVHQADPDNPELLEAAARGIPVLHRSAVLAELMADHRAACVSGSAGKTSTTSMLVVALQACGTDPSFMIGGDLLASGSSAHHGHGDVFVAEADESDGSFLAYSPAVAIVTNVEPDHLDHHGTVEAYVAVFDAFAARIEPGGALVVCADDPGAAALGDRAAAAGIRVRRYGRAATGPEDVTVLGYRAEASTGVLTIRVGGDAAGWSSTGSAGVEHTVRLGVAGEHQALNACAALLAGLDLGAPLDRLLAGLASFTGVRRRFELRGEAHGVRVYDDYAHAPTKVDAQLRAARPVLGERGRLIVAFQPHLYSRTRDFAEQFGAALSLADEVVLLDVYGAREQPEPGVNGATIARHVTLPPEHVHYEPSWAAVPSLLADLARPGDLVITMGAGDVTVLGPEILTEIEGRETPAHVGG